MTKSSINAVIFDLGRVLVGLDGTSLIIKELSANNASLIQTMSNNRHIIAFNCGRISPEAFHQNMCRDFGLKMEYDVFVSHWCGIFYPIDEMEDLVTQLNGRVKLGLLSDTNSLHWDYLFATRPWLGVFKNPTLSHQVGVMKPNPQIYLTAAKHVDTPPEHCLFVDDLQVNVEGARAIGMTAVQFENPAQIKDVLKNFNLL